MTCVITPDRTIAALVCINPGAIPLKTARAWVDVFFFQAEDGIRDLIVTGVQTCALPISRAVEVLLREAKGPAAESDLHPGDLIVAVDDEPVDGIDALHRRLGRVPPGTTLTLKVVRRTHLVDIALAVREPP